MKKLLFSFPPIKLLIIIICWVLFITVFSYFDLSGGPAIAFIIVVCVVGEHLLRKINKD